ncbi:hypothetical protein [Engelhardtia mirabilis]|uniref:Uncharacterized protein n=1 Tax=Engelhardtia mirabilis TaxID=2528011 RepID=A0A518BLW0_9BACT|nr:hypothetical protein Pla133_30520 [Planctomycetes bacterium Pla133]QDV02287.1 hypothetical protein Pla86_30510 [Planctomycetes bacterium Pla86]
MTTHTSLSLLVLTLLAAPAQTPLEWSPPPGAELAADHRVQWKLEFEGAAIQIMGEDQDPADFIEGYDEDAFSRDIELAFAARDSELRLPLGDTADGPLSFVREYGEFTVDGETPDMAEGLTEGARVLFRRDGDDGWERRLLAAGDDATDSKAGEPLESLSALAEDLGFRHLVPGEAVEAGATWRVYLSGQDLFDLVAGGLDAAGAPTIAAGLGAEDDERELLGRLGEFLDVLAEGATVDCTLVSVEADDDGRELARIGLALEHEGTLELSQYFTDTVKFDDGSGEGRTPEVEAEMAVSYSGTGELTWDLAAGCFAAFELTVEFEAELDVDLAADFDAFTFEIHADLDWTGELTHTAEGSAQ